MKIRVKLAIWFSLIVGAIVLFISATIYFSYSVYKANQFEERIFQKADNTARLLLQVEEVDNNLLRIIDRNSIHKLFNEKVIVFDEENQVVYSSLDEEEIDYSDSIIAHIRKVGKFTSLKDNYQVVGIRFTDESHDYVVLASALDKYGQIKLLNLKKILIIVSLISLVLAAFASYFYTHQALRPIDKINKQIIAISGNNLNSRVTVSGSGDEISELAQNFNNMLDRLSEAFSSQKQFIQHASHELRTPLSTILSQIELALKTNRSVEYHQALLKSLLEDTNKMADLANILLTQLALENTKLSENWKPVRADELVLEAQEQLITAYPQVEVHLDYLQIPDDDAEFFVNGNPILLRSLFFNLMENAFKYGNNSPIVVLLKIDAGKFIVQISDSGNGISQFDVPHIFKPFYRSETIRSQKGFGLGLTLCKRIADLHNAEIFYEPNKPIGSTFTIVMNQYRLR